MNTTLQRSQSRRQVTRAMKGGLDYLALAAGAIFLLFPQENMNCTVYR